MSKKDCAFTLSTPSSHTEKAFLLCCVINNHQDILDEYHRRKSGQMSQLPDHPLLDLSYWMVPDTARLPIFQDQVVAIFRKLCDPLISAGEVDNKIHLLRRTMDEKVSFEMFKESLLPVYKESLSEHDLESVYFALWWAFGYLHDYCYYSTITSRLEAKFGGQLHLLTRGQILSFIQT